MDDDRKNDPGWHRWFGNLFKEALTPLGIEVKTEFFVMTDPPSADIVIIRKPMKEWTKEQSFFLPDGKEQQSRAYPNRIQTHRIP